MHSTVVVKNRLQLVDQTFDVAFEAMYDNDQARRVLPCTQADIDAFIDGLFYETIELADADIEICG